MSLEHGQLDYTDYSTLCCIASDNLLLKWVSFEIFCSGGFGGRGGHGGGRGGPMRGQPPYGSRGGPGGYSRDPYPNHPPPPAYMRERMDGYVSGFLFIMREAINAK